MAKTTNLLDHYSTKTREPLIRAGLEAIYITLENTDPPAALIVTKRYGAWSCECDKYRATNRPCNHIKKLLEKLLEKK